MTPAHEFIIVGEGVYRVEVPARGIVLQVDRLRRRNDELIGELTVTCDLAGAARISDDGIVSAAESLVIAQLRAELRASRAA